MLLWLGVPIGLNRVIAISETCPVRLATGETHHSEVGLFRSKLTGNSHSFSCRSKSEGPRTFATSLGFHMSTESLVLNIADRLLSPP